MRWAAIILGIFILLVAIAYAASIQQKQTALNRIQLYLENSSGEVWNASDFMALAVLADRWNVSLSNAKIWVEAKKKFDFTEYPFTASALQGKNAAPPSAKEIALGSPLIYYRLYTCGTFTPEEFIAFSNAVNTWENPYAATHAVFYMNFMKRNYGNQGAGCKNNAHVTNATTVLSALQNNLLLNPPVIPFPNRYDAYVSQECARGLITNTVPEPIIDYLLPGQDQNTLEPLTFGGFYHSGARVNEPYMNYDENGNALGIVYPELPSGHTTMMAGCAILLNLGVGT